MLKLCLESLMAQTVTPDRFKVLVVDNNSIDDTAETADAYISKLSIRTVRESAQGLSQARNRGLLEADTDWVAYLDDDAKAAPGWVETVKKAIDKADFDAFGGPYFAWHHFGPPPAWLPENYGTYAPQQGYGPLVNNTYIPGGNCALKKEQALKAGLFPANTGMVGNKCAYGEESELFKRMQHLGSHLGFVPDMRIEHCVLPYKYRLGWLLKSSFRRGNAIAAHEAPASRCKYAGRQFLRCGKHFCKFLLQFPALLIGNRRAATTAAINFAIALGALCEVLRSRSGHA
jgi:glycosyltransferase involved in cell wall biosynthesis